MSLVCCLCRCRCLCLWLCFCPPMDITSIYLCPRLSVSVSVSVSVSGSVSGSASMGWLRLLGSSKLQVSSAEYRLFYRALLQKRPINLRSLLIVATPYPLMDMKHCTVFHMRCETLYPVQCFVFILIPPRSTLFYIHERAFVSHVFHMCFICVSYVFHMCFICVSYVFHMCFICVSYVFHMCFISTSVISMRYETLNTLVESTHTHTCTHARTTHTYIHTQTHASR